MSARSRARMTGQQRREQLLTIGRRLFAEKGFEGASVEEVAARASRVLTRVLPAMEEGDVALVAHGHYLRILASVFLRMAPRFGQALTLDAGSVSVLGYYREAPAVLTWNRGPELPKEPSES